MIRIDLFKVYGKFILTVYVSVFDCCLFCLPIALLKTSTASLFTVL